MELLGLLLANEDCSAPNECWGSRTYVPQEGSYFALLAPGKPSEATRISQPFTASNGDKVSGWAFFQTQYKEPWGAEPRYDAVGRVVLTDDSGKTVATLFEKRYSSGWTGWETRWTHWEHTFTGVTGTGTFQIEAQVQNTGERASECWGNLNYCDSVLGLDDVKTSTGDLDTTAPKVISTVPTGNATGVDRTTNVTATFSENMLASSINGQTFKLFRKGSTTKLSATVSYPDANSPPYTAKLDPTNSLHSGRSYKAVLTTGAKDLAGNPLAQQYRWFFTVR